MALKMEVKGNKLVIEVDVSDDALKNAPMSKTGKSRMVATTGGFNAVNDKVRVSLNVITK